MSPTSRLRARLPLPALLTTLLPALLTTLLPALLTTLLTATACSQDAAEPAPPDTAQLGTAKPDTDAETATDTATDTETATDTATDTETATDTATATDTDTATAESDTDTETATDTAESDTATDTATDTETATDTDPEPDIPQQPPLPPVACPALGVTATIPGDVCFVASPPEPGVAVADIPIPDATACPQGLPTFQGLDPTALPAPSLNVEIGYAADDTGLFVPYEPNGWAALSHGTQNGFHLWTAFRVPLPDVGVAKKALQVTASALIGCDEVAKALAPQVFALQDATLPDGYTNATAAQPGLQTVFTGQNSAQSCTFCGKWVRLRVAVRDPESGAWGQSEAVLRMYDTAPLVQ
jgi:hypothetical protein